MFDFPPLKNVIQSWFLALMFPILVLKNANIKKKKKRRLPARLMEPYARCPVVN